MAHEAGKGDTQRPTNWDHFSENFERIFGSKPTEKEKEALRRQLEDAKTLASYPAGSKKRKGK